MGFFPCMLVYDTILIIYRDRVLASQQLRNQMYLLLRQVVIVRQASIAGGKVTVQRLRVLKDKRQGREKHLHSR